MVIGRVFDPPASFRSLARVHFGNLLIVLPFQSCSTAGKSCSLNTCRRPHNAKGGGEHATWSHAAHAAGSVRATARYGRRQACTDGEARGRVGLWHSSCWQCASSGKQHLEQRNVRRAREGWAVGDRRRRQMFEPALDELGPAVRCGLRIEVRFDGGIT